MSNICCKSFLFVLVVCGMMILGCSENDDSVSDGDFDMDTEAEHEIEPDGDLDEENDEQNENDLEPENDNEQSEDEIESFDPTVFVDPFIGTSGDTGQLSPAASYPFGMVLLGPDSMLGNHAGYNYDLNLTVGFSHTRINGVGCDGVGGDLKILPLTEKDASSQKMNKDSEIASPGYYAVELGEEKNIKAEMTVSEHSGMHRYTFSENGNMYLLFDLTTSLAGRVEAEWSASVDSQEINGWFSARNVCNEGQYKLYFSAKFNKSFAVIDEQKKNSDIKRIVLDFGLSNEAPLLSKVGLSSVDIESARNDRDTEIQGWDFDLVHSSAQKAWQKELSKIEIRAESELSTLFYTMLYRTMHTPANITTSKDEYRGTDGEVHKAEGYHHYHSWSLWDTYRNKFALITLLDSVRSGEIMQSLVDVYNQGKTDWSTDNEPYPNVRTEHSQAILLDAYMKGVTGFDLRDAYNAIVSEAQDLPLDSPDTKLETSYDRWAIAQIARILEDETAYGTYMNLSAEYKSEWVTTFKTMGDNADIMHAEGLYEGTLWQYRWAVVHDIYGMIEADGGTNAFLDKLNYYFDNELHNHGNEPDIHAPFLYNYVGKAEKTQDLVRRLLIEEVNQWYGTHKKWDEPYTGRIYKVDPEGLIPEMDDDDGTMSAWFVLASLGIYPVTVGWPVYMLTAPLYEQSVINLNDEVKFTIRAENVSEVNRYIQAATLNGETFNRAWIKHDEIARGGELIFQMGSEPNLQWGNSEDDFPPNSFE